MLTRTASTLCLVLALAPLPAAGQTPASPRVEVEAYGGLTRVLDSGQTTLSPLPAGAPIGTSSPLFPSRRVSTWLFGDGASLLNSAATDLELVSRLTPLDAAIGAMGRGAQTTGSAGARLRLRTAPRVWTEFGLDVSTAAADLPDSVADAVEATRATFVSTFAELLASGPFTNRAVTATTSLGEGGSRDVTASLAANIELTPRAGLTPYLTLGAAVVARTGTPASFSLSGRYAGRILGSSPIDESDRVTVRSAARPGVGIVAGTGVTRSAGRVTLRLDARLVAVNRTISANVDATPSVTTGTPADFIESFTNPSIQFSNNASTGRRSTLSGDALDHLDVARSTRLQVRTQVTIGVGIRF